MKITYHFLNEVSGRYAANNFNAVMAKNAKLTIVEAGTFFINDLTLEMMMLITLG
jgi:acyl CoA:acetate/3-ketoacid CoA transferase alpha subunit